MSRRSLLIKIIVPIITLLVGAVFPILFDRITKEFTEQQVTLLIILIFSLAATVLVITYSVLFDQTRDDQHKINSGQIDILNEVKSGRISILDELKRLADQFGLVVDFIEESPDDEGITYERTTKLIEEAEDSLIFLDAWVQTTHYHLESPRAAARRQAYYDAIINQIEKHKQTRNHFHKRIIQMTGGWTDTNHFVLIAGSVFSNYIRKAYKLQKDFPGSSTIRIANLFIHASFVIIDRFYVVWPILTYTPGGEGLKRHGAIIFNDPRQVLVQHLMGIFEMIDSNSQKCTAHHLGLDENEL
jgi:hypothetical protein